MSKKEEEPLYRIKENEELILDDIDGKRGKAKPKKKKKTSSTESNGPASPLIR